MGFVDRGGGREAKGSSLRRSKKNPGAASTRNKSAMKNYTTPATRITPVPPASLVPILQCLATKAARDEAEAAATGGRDQATTNAQPHDDSSRTSSSDAAAYAVAAAAFVKEVRQLMKDSFPSTTANTKAATNDVEAHALAIDGAVALLSRKLEVDVEAVFRRAVEEGHLSAMLCWCNELERQPLLMETCRNHNKLALPAAEPTQARSAAAAATPGVTDGGKKKSVHFAGGDGEGDEKTGTAAAGEESVKGRRAIVDSIIGGSPSARGGGPAKRQDVALYCVIGVHVNSIDRTSRKMQEQWIQELSRQAKSPEVLGILSGLNLGRDSGTHYAQEWTLRECWRVAAELRLPLVLHIYSRKSSNNEETVAVGAADSDVTTDNHAAVVAGAETDVGADVGDAMILTANRVAEILHELITAAAASEHPCSAAPVAVVLHNGLPPLAASTALCELFRTHRPTTNLSTLVRLHATEGEESVDMKMKGTTAKQTVVVPFYALATAEGLTMLQASSESPDGGPRAPALASLLTPSRHPPASYGDGRDEGDRKPYATSPVVGLSQLLIGTGSPWATPQNLPDEHLRQLPNEPGNFPFVVEAIRDAMGAGVGNDANTNTKSSGTEGETAAANDAWVSLTASDLASIALRNFLCVFFTEHIRDAVQRRRAAAHGSGSEEGCEDGTGAGAGAEERRFASRDVHSRAVRAHVAAPTAYVCVKCRSPLFYSSAVQTHKQGAQHAPGASDSAALSGGGDTGKKANRKGNRGQKKGKGRRVDSSDDENELDDRNSYADNSIDERNAYCGSASAILLHAQLDSREAEDLASVKGNRDLASLLAHVAGYAGEHHQGVFVIQNNNSNSGGGATAVVACAACQAKLGEAQLNGSCYDCGHLLRGITLRVRPRAVEECPVLDGVETSTSAHPLHTATASATAATTAASSAGCGSKRQKGRVGHRATAAAEAVSGGDSNDDGHDGSPESEEGTATAEEVKEMNELEMLLAAAARERELLEREKQQEEAALSGSHNDDGRRKKARKKNVKANNRSNFTHFRNKDFAPRLAKEKKLNHQRHIEGFAGSSGSHSNTDSDHDNDDSGSDHEGNRSEGSDDSNGGGDVHRELATSEAKSRLKTLQDELKELEKETVADEESATMATAGTRRQRKKANKKRHQQQQPQQVHSQNDGDSNDESD